MLKFCKFYIENESKFHYQVVGTEEDEEAMEQLVLNAQNLMQSVKVPYILIHYKYILHYDVYHYQTGAFRTLSAQPKQLRSKLEQTADFDYGGFGNRCGPTFE